MTPGFGWRPPQIPFSPIAPCLNTCRAFLTTSCSIARFDSLAVVRNEKIAVAKISPPSSSGPRSGVVTLPVGTRKTLQ